MIILPSLEIVPAKYDGSTLLSQIPIDGTGDFTVTRATSPTTGQSTRVNALGRIELVADNVPRLDYPIGGGCPALLVEPSATNLVPNGTAFNTSTDLSFTNSSDSPASSISGTLITKITGVTGGVFAQQTCLTSLPSGSTTYTISRFFKYNGTDLTTSLQSNVSTQWGGTNWTQQVVISAASGVTLGTSTNCTGSVENYGNGWYRVSARLTAGASPSGSTTVQYLMIVAGSVASGSSFLTALPQLEVGSIATSYIPTTTQAITRSNEIMTRTSASGLIGQSEGAIYWDIAAVGSVPTGTGNPELNIRNEAFTNWIGLTSNSSPNPFRITVKAVAGNLINYQASITSGKAAVAWSSAGAVLYVNGVQVATSATNPNFSFSRAEIRGSTMAFKANAFALYPTRLTDTQLALLTSPYTSYSSMASALSYTLG